MMDRIVRSAGRGRVPNRRRAATVLAVAVSLAGFTPGRSAPQPPGDEAPLEYRVKAAFIYNFARFVEWPDTGPTESTPPFVIGILGADPFGTTLDELIADKGVNGRSLIVKRFEDERALEPCSILFVGARAARRLPQILERIGGQPVLTVGQSDRFTERGGIIRFFDEDNHVRFEINVDAAQRAGLLISSKLLALARVVHDPIDARR